MRHAPDIRDFDANARCKTCGDPLITINPDFAFVFAGVACKCARQASNDPVGNGSKPLHEHE